MLKSCLAIPFALFLALLAGCATFQKAGSGQTITASTSIKDVPITVSYRGGVFYRVQVNNTLPAAITLLWDESTYVATDGKSVRILRMDNRHNLPDYAPARQAASVIPAGAQFESDFTGEEWLDCARRNCTPKAKNSEGRARIVLAFEIRGKQVRWQGDVSFAPPGKQP